MTAHERSRQTEARRTFFVVLAVVVLFSCLTPFFF